MSVVCVYSVQVQRSCSEQQPQTFLVWGGVSSAETRALQSQSFGDGRWRWRWRGTCSSGRVTTWYRRSCRSCQGINPTTKSCREGQFTELFLQVSRSLPVVHDEMESKICSGLKRCLYVSSQANECQRGFKLASNQGIALVLKGSTGPIEPSTCAPRLICRVHTYLTPLQSSCLWQAHGDVNSCLQD